MRGVLPTAALPPPSDDQPHPPVEGHSAGCPHPRLDADAADEDTKVLLRPAGAPASGAGLPIDRTSPVFVDTSGRRRLVLRCCGAVLAVGCVGFAALLWMSVTGGVLSGPHTTIPAVETSAQTTSTDDDLPNLVATGPTHRHSRGASAHVSRHASSRASSHTAMPKTSRTV